MEVGAVKQAFNNEVIHLKKKMNQAKTQVIHKLTRKVKTFTEKKGPKQLQLKLRRKAESAVKEVLLIKKLTAKDLAKFSVTHEGDLSKYLNKPTVDNDKACARLLLHKTLQDKYKILRQSFTNIGINDLLMSREERKKLKKEAMEKRKKTKNKNSSNSVSVDGNWSIEDIGTASVSKTDNNVDISDNSGQNNNDSDNEMEHSDEDGDNNDDGDGDDTRDEDEDNIEDDLDKEFSDESESASNIIDLKQTEQKLTSKEQSDTDSKAEFTMFKIKTKPSIVKNDKSKKQTDSIKTQNKFTEKLLARKQKQLDVMHKEDNKIADPFFITSTGENYMSLVEPRAPDEVKEVHREGNRKLRRAAMFGHIPKFKPRKEFNNNRNGFTKEPKDKQNFRNNKPDQSVNRTFDQKRNENKEKKDFSNRGKSEVSEKLHPSWEAKKKQSGLLPFQGKKIVFD